MRRLALVSLIAIGAGAALVLIASEWAIEKLDESLTERRAERDGLSTEAA